MGGVQESGRAQLVSSWCCSWCLTSFMSMYFSFLAHWPCCRDVPCARLWTWCRWFVQQDALAMCKKLLTCFVNLNLGRGILHEILDANRVFIGLILRLFDTICVCFPVVRNTSSCVFDYQGSLILQVTTVRLRHALMGISGNTCKNKLFLDLPTSSHWGRIGKAKQSSLQLQACVAGGDRRRAEALLQQMVDVGRVDVVSYNTFYAQILGWFVTLNFCRHCACSSSMSSFRIVCILLGVCMFSFPFLYHGTEIHQATP